MAAGRNRRFGPAARFRRADRGLANRQRTAREAPRNRVAEPFARRSVVVYYYLALLAKRPPVAIADYDVAVLALDGGRFGLRLDRGRLPIADLADERGPRLVPPHD